MYKRYNHSPDELTLTCFEIVQEMYTSYSQPLDPCLVLWSISVRIQKDMQLDLAFCRPVVHHGSSSGCPCHSENVCCEHVLGHICPSCAPSPPSPLPHLPLPPTQPVLHTASTLLLKYFCLKSESFLFILSPFFITLKHTKLTPCELPPSVVQFLSP